MIHKEYTWKGNDGIMLFGQSWEPAKTPEAVINYVHGFKDHSNRFAKWAVRLADLGYAVIAIDLRGHGRSQGRRGYAPGYTSYLSDVSVLRNHAEELFGSRSLHILYGHSLGGNLVANHLISEKKLPDAAVLTSPWFTLTEKPSWLKLAAVRLIRYILPQLVVKSDIDARYLSRDCAVVDEYLNDPLVHNRIRPKLFLEIEQKGLVASRSIYKINIPLLVMHGSGDNICSFRQTKNFVMNSGNLTTFKEWPGAYHELYNDLPEKEVFDFLVQWIKKQTARS